MKNLCVRGELIEMIQTISNIEISDSPIEGLQLDQLAKVLSTWAKSKNFTTDCILSGLDTARTMLTIEEISVCAEHNEPVFL